MKLTKKTRQETHVQNKGWGYELWIENDIDYCGKILHFKKGKMCSLHYHMEKLETMYLQSGHLQIMFIDTETAEQYVIDLLPGDSIQIPRGQPHQIAAVEESDLFEFSTQHFEEDSYRVWKGD